MGACASKAAPGDGVETVTSPAALKAAPAASAPQDPKAGRPQLQHDTPLLTEQAAHEDAPPAAGKAFKPASIVQVSAQPAELADLQGQPYNCFLRGPPLPPCNAERVGYMKELGSCFDVPPDPQVEHIISLICRVFDCGSAMMALCGTNRIYIRNSVGFQQGDFPWRYSFCGWSLAPANSEVLVVEDALQDARFHDNAFVMGAPGVRFYAGTPMIGSTGHRLGTLCFADTKPRKMTAENCQILSNMAELVVRELERDYMAQQEKKKNDQVMLRALDCFEEAAVLFVDVRSEQWTILHTNSVFTKVTGVSHDAAHDAGFWDIFQRPYEEDSAPWEAVKDVAARRGEFIIHSVPVCAKGGTDATFTMRFRPGSKDVLDENTPIIGVPSYIGSQPHQNDQYYFVIATRNRGSRPSRNSLNSLLGGLHTSLHNTCRQLLNFPYSATGSLTPPRTPLQRFSRGSLQPLDVPFEQVELGNLLGKGSFGRVYRATWKGKPAAVKIVEGGPGQRQSGKLSPGGSKAPPPWKTVEALKALDLTHPNVVRTYQHTTVMVEGEDYQPLSADRGSGPTMAAAAGVRTSSGRTSIAEVETWLLMELCDKGSLMGAVDRGWFRKERAVKDGPPNMATILATASQIANGMAYLHQRDVIHGDLSGGNILLGADPNAPHGFCAKVGDFGMSREMTLATRMQTATYGTVTHMPPELLSSGQLSKACDVFSFGVLLWEMLTGARAWACLNHAQVINAVAVEGRRPVFPDDAPPGFAALSKACMAAEAATRPSFMQCLEYLEALKLCPEVPMALQA